MYLNGKYNNRSGVPVTFFFHLTQTHSQSFPKHINTVYIKIKKIKTLVGTGLILSHKMSIFK